MRCWVILIITFTHLLQIYNGRLQLSGNLSKFRGHITAVRGHIPQTPNNSTTTCVPRSTPSHCVLGPFSPPIPPPLNSMTGFFPSNSVTTIFNPFAGDELPSPGAPSVDTPRQPLNRGPDRNSGLGGASGIGGLGGLNRNSRGGGCAPRAAPECPRPRPPCMPPPPASNGSLLVLHRHQRAPLTAPS